MCLDVDNTTNDTEPVTEEDSAIEQILDPDHRQEQLWQRFLRRLQEGAWGDNTVLQATADMTGLIVAILTYRPSYPAGHYTIITPQGRSETRSDDPDTLHLGFIPQQHYTSLEKGENVTSSGSEEDSVDNGDKQTESEDDCTVKESEDQQAFEEACKLCGLPFDSYLQNENLDHIFSVAPAEGNKPLPLFSDELFEELANLDKFPNGSGAFTSIHRMTRLTLGKYVNACLLDQDGRFAKDIEYIFAMQYAVEHKQVHDSINIALCQVRGRQFQGNEVSAECSETLRMCKIFAGMTKNICGSPPYRQKIFYETLAMIRTLGIPT